MQSVERNEIFDLAFRFVTETQESIFLTGKAGTGKTTFLKYLKEHCSKNIIVAAPTGVAAINAGGVTLHSLFQLPFHPFLPTNSAKSELLSKIRYNKQRLHLLRKMELLVIDEISMVRCDVMDAIDTILRSVRYQHHVPFGGVQLLFIGDLFQLPPVAQNQEWSILQEYYSSSFFFDSQVIKEQMPLLIELNKIYRQKEQSFVELLNKVRNNQIEREDFDQLNQRYIPGFQPLAEEKYITLTSHNNQAELINRQQLQKLTSSAFTYKADIEGEFSENTYPADAELILKEGAQVMFLKNDTVAKRYFNGKIGIVKSLDDAEIIVTSDGEDIHVLKEIWENSRYTLNRSDGKLEQEVMGTFEQYPLRLAWAITIHKSQGLTFDKVMIDAGASFSSGQVYVALSRCTSIDGIVLLSKINPSVIFNNQHVLNGQNSLTTKGSLAERFAQARKLFTQLLLEDLFSFGQTEIAIKQLQQNIIKHKHELNEEAEAWVEELLQQFDAEKTVAQKFIIRIHELLKEEGVVEQNPALQKRIQDAATYFLPRITALQQTVNQHPLITELKTAADEVNEHLQSLCIALHTSAYLLQYGKEVFSVTVFLKHKLNLAIPNFRVTSYAGNKKQTVSNINHAELYFQLKEWRDRVCEENNLPIYMLANSNSLTEICTYLPLAKNHLMMLSGFGKAKVEKYGDEILEMVERYCSEHHIETNIEAKEANPKRQRKEPSTPKAEKVSSFSISLQYYKEGKTIDEIAKLRNFANSTIEGHLAEAVKHGEISVFKLVSDNKVEVIKEAIVSNPEMKSGELKGLLGDEYTFAEIRAVVNHLSRLDANQDVKPSSQNGNTEDVF
ncbi:MAG: AAA family ATPase [Chitinophagaceae bacterium]|nr:AAA family ATPase [Chitinophagaceae bacterium]